MDARVSGHQVEASEALQEHVTGRISAMADRFFAVRLPPRSLPARDCTTRASTATSSRRWRTAFSPRPAEEPAPENPPIVAETRIDISETNVGDAVMMLDLRNTNALMFRNSKTGESNMVYRRDDGTIG